MNCASSISKYKLTSAPNSSYTRIVASITLFGEACNASLVIMQILWTDTHGNGLSYITCLLLQFLAFSAGRAIVCPPNVKVTSAPLSFTSASIIVHLRSSDESCNELVAWFVVQILWRIYLLDHTVFHNNDSGTQCHSLGLVMCYIDDSVPAVSDADLEISDTHLASQFCIQVGQRLIHQEYLRITNDSTSHSNSLSLTTGQSLWFTI